MVADAMAPAGQPNVPSDVAVAERAAGVGAVTMHGFSEKGWSGSGIGASARPAKRVRVYPSPTGAATEWRAKLRRQLPIRGLSLCWLDDGAFPLRQFLRGAARGLFRPRRAHSRARAKTGEAE